MFIKVKIPSLNEFSKLILEIVNTLVTIINEIKKIIIAKKYLFISSFSVVVLVKETLFKYIWFGFVWDKTLFAENLIRLKTFITRKPELVEKKDPPIITKIKKTNVKSFEILLKEIPKFETLLHIETKISKKLLVHYRKEIFSD